MTEKSWVEKINRDLDAIHESIALAMKDRALSLSPDERKKLSEHIAAFAQVARDLLNQKNATE